MIIYARSNPTFLHVQARLESAAIHLHDEPVRQQPGLDRCRSGGFVPHRSISCEQPYDHFFDLGIESESLRMNLPRLVVLSHPDDERMPGSPGFRLSRTKHDVVIVWFRD